MTWLWLFSLPAFAPLPRIRRRRYSVCGVFDPTCYLDTLVCFCEVSGNICDFLLAYHLLIAFSRYPVPKNLSTHVNRAPGKTLPTFLVLYSFPARDLVFA